MPLPFNSTHKTAMSLAMLSGANVFLAFLFQWSIFVIIGPGIETDALFAGMAIPQLVLSILSGSLVYVLVPLLVGHDERKFGQYVWTSFVAVGAIFGALAFVLSLTAPLWVSYMVPGFSSHAMTLTVTLVRIQLIGMLFAALYSVLVAALQAKRRFITGELILLFTTALSLPALGWALGPYGIVAAAWVSVIRVGVQVLLLHRALSPHIQFNLDLTILGTVWFKLKPLLFGASYYKLDILVDRFLASMTAPGGLSLLYFGQQIFNAASQILTTSIATPAVPVLAGYAKETDWISFRRVYRRRLAWLTAITLCGYLVFLLVGKYALHILIGHGGVTEQNVLVLWKTMAGLGGVLVGGAMGQILSTAFYASGDTKTPTKIGIIGFTAGVIFKVVGFFQFGLYGIALAGTIHYLLNTTILYVSLERKLASANSH